MATLNPILTQVGVAALEAHQRNGTKAELSHIVLGDANEQGYLPDKTMIQLINPRDEIKVTDGEVYSKSRLRVIAELYSDDRYPIYEIGFLVTPVDNEQPPILLAVHSDTGAELAKKPDNTHFVIDIELYIQGIADGLLTITSSYQRLLSQATPDSKGLVKLATTDDILNGTDNKTGVTVAGLYHKLSETADAKKMPLADHQGFISPSWFLHSLTADQLPDGSISTMDIEPNSISQAQIAQAGISAEHLDSIPYADSQGDIASSWIQNPLTTFVPQSIDYNNIASELGVWSGSDVVHIQTQRAFEDIFGVGAGQVQIDPGTTIILSPIQGVINGDLATGAWGGMGDEAQHTFNGNPAYILKNSVKLQSNVTIIGFNPSTTIIVKGSNEGAQEPATLNRFLLEGSEEEWINGITLKGWSFDGRGGLIDFNGVNLGGELALIDQSGGGFYLRYCEETSLNCHIVNQRISVSDIEIDEGKGGAIYGEEGTCRYITANHIYHCAAYTGGGAYGLGFSEITVFNTTAESHGGGACRCSYGQLTIYGSRAQDPGWGIAVYGGGASQCDASHITLFYCQAIGTNALAAGGGVDSSQYCEIIAYNCAAVNESSTNDGFAQGGGVYQVEKSTIRTFHCQVIQIEGGSGGFGGSASESHYNTITAVNCRAPFGSGGGLYHCDYTSPLLMQCSTSADDFAAGKGGGAYGCNYMVPLGVWCENSSAEKNNIYADGANWLGTFATDVTAIHQTTASTRDLD
jgi:hypothetical protein